MFFSDIRSAMSFIKIKKSDGPSWFDIFLIFDIPSIIKKKWHKRKLIKINKKLLYVLAELLMGNRKKSLSQTNSIINDIDEDNKEVINLVLAEAEPSFDKKIQYYRISWLKIRVNYLSNHSVVADISINHTPLLFLNVLNIVCSL